VSSNKLAPNDEYRLIYAGEELRSLKSARQSIRESAELEWSQRVDAEKKRLQPRRKKRDDPPVEWLQDLRSELFTKYKINDLDEQVKAAENVRLKKLSELSCLVEFSCDQVCMHRNEVSFVDSYRSVGWGAAKYAKAQLLPMYSLLQSLGFELHIREVFGYLSHLDGYALWSNCVDWMYDAAKHRLTWEIISKAIGRTVNPQVLYPFLTNDLVDSHYATGGSGVQV